MRVTRWRVTGSQSLAVEMVPTSEPSDRHRLCAVLPWLGTTWGAPSIDMEPTFDPMLAEAAKGFVQRWLRVQGLPIILHSFDAEGHPKPCLWQLWRDGGGPTP